MNLKATGPVNINYQIVFVILSFFFIPLHIWGFYRIGKLRRYFQLVCVPILFIVLLNIIPTNPEECDLNWLLYFLYDSCESWEYNMAYALLDAAFMVYSIYLIRKWSVQWNQEVNRIE